MQLNQNSWHAKLYFFTTTLFEIWKKGDLYTPPEFGDVVETNLCPYVRRILWTFPCLLIFYTSVVGWLVWVILIYPLSYFGLMYFATIAGAIGMIGAIVLVIWGFVTIWPGIGRFYRTYIYNPVLDVIDRVFDASKSCIMGKPDAPSFCAVLRQWIIDRHHQFCRDITITKGD